MTATTRQITPVENLTLTHNPSSGPPIIHWTTWALACSPYLWWLWALGAAAEDVQWTQTQLPRRWPETAADSRGHSPHLERAALCLAWLTSFDCAEQNISWVDGTWVALAYDFHEDLLPVLTGLETSVQSRRLWKAGQLLLNKVLPLKEVGISLEGGFPLVRGLFCGGARRLLVMSPAVKHATVSWRDEGLTDSKAMDNQRTLPPCIPTAPWESWPGSRLGSGREWQSGCSRGRTEDSLFPGRNQRNTIKHLL